MRISIFALAVSRVSEGKVPRRESSAWMYFRLDGVQVSAALFVFADNPRGREAGRGEPALREIEAGRRPRAIIYGGLSLAPRATDKIIYRRRQRERRGRS